MYRGMFENIPGFYSLDEKAPFLCWWQPKMSVDVARSSRADGVGEHAQLRASVTSHPHWFFLMLHVCFTTCPCISSAHYSFPHNIFKVWPIYGRTLLHKNGKLFRTSLYRVFSFLLHKSIHEPLSIGVLGKLFEWLILLISQNLIINSSNGCQEIRDHKHSVKQNPNREPEFS